MLICPKCKEKLFIDNNSYKCLNNHTYDISKEGYVNLLLANQKKMNSGDNAVQVRARDNFLKKDYYKILAEELIKTVASLNLEEESFILDSGCGTAYYLNALKEKLKFNYLGFDISKNAIKKGAKSTTDLKLIIASIINIPIKDNSIQLIYNVFSPYNLEEYNRLLLQQGYFINITPGEKHLYEIKEILYQKPYLNSTKFINSNLFELIDNKVLKYQITLQNADLINLFTMTPYFYKTKETSKERLFEIDSLKLTFDFNITIYKKRN